MAREHPKMATGDWEIIRLVGAVPTGRAGILALAYHYTCTCGYSRPHKSYGVEKCGNCDRTRTCTYTKDATYAMRSWRHGETRFFATLLTGDGSFWQLWLTAACGKTAADKFRAEIRLSSSLMPKCNSMYYWPVLHFESPILIEKTSIAIDGYAACLQVHQKIVRKHIKRVVTIADLLADTTNPFTVNVYEKVFLTPDKADIEEKDESDGVPE